MFVVGAPRSGTTLLRRLLSAHPELLITHELRVLDLAAGVGWSACHRGKWPSAGDHARREELALGWPFVERLYRRLAQHQGATVLGDKYPPDALRLPALLRLVPGARVVHMLRDGRDVVSSTMRAVVERAAWRRSLEPPGAAEMARSWALHVQAARRDGLPLGPARFLELRYEDLTRDPAQTCRRALDFVGLGPHPAVDAAAQEVHPGRSWRQTLHPDDLHDALEAPNFARTLEAVGYPVGADLPAPAPPSPLAGACRELRQPGTPDAAVVQVLARADHPASLFAAMHARDSTTPSVQAALRSWMEQRGLPAHMAQAFGAGETP